MVPGLQMREEPELRRAKLCPGARLTRIGAVNVKAPLAARCHEPRSGGWVIARAGRIG
jgi:hypothetical protein